MKNDKSPSAEHPMTNEEIETIKNVLEMIIKEPSRPNMTIKYYIKKALELIIRFQVENSLLKKQLKFYEDKEINK